MPPSKTIAITMGEPGGVGPEIALKAAKETMRTMQVRAHLVGSLGVWSEAASVCKVSLDGFTIIDTGPCEGFIKGAPSAAGGAASAAAIRKAVELAMSGEADAIVTAPISKEALRMTGLHWPGHTEMLAELTNTREYAMMLMGAGLRVMLVTTHAAMADVPRMLTRDSVLGTIRLARRACSMLQLPSARIAVTGLNPHAGESGMFGSEEREHIAPAIEAARKEGIDATGPLPADTVFHRAVKLSQFDIVVCMYHDQGLGPLKLLAFDSGVNATIGLPIIRTSPDHGTAYDIAWQNRASTTSMLEAINTALALKIR